MAPPRRSLGLLKMILNGVKITKFNHVLRNTNCPMTCHVERVAVLFSVSQIALSRNLGK
jgi:hypothetical protein